MKRVFKPFEEGSSDIILIHGNQNMTTGGSRRERKQKRKSQESDTKINIDDISTASTSNTLCPAEPETITDFNEILSPEFEDENVPPSIENENFQDTHDAEETRIKKTSSKGNNTSGSNNSGNRCGSSNVGSGSSNGGGCDNGSGFHTGECQPRNARGRRLRRNSTREDGKPVHKRQKQAILAFCEEKYYFDDRRPKEVWKKKRHTKTVYCMSSPPLEKAKQRSCKKKKASSSNAASPSNMSPLPAASPSIMVLPPDNETPPPHIQDSVTGDEPGRDIEGAAITGDPPSTGTTFGVKPITSSTDAQAGTEDCMQEYAIGSGTRAVTSNVPASWVVPATYYEPNVPMYYIDATIVYANVPWYSAVATNPNAPTYHANATVPTSPETPDYSTASFQALTAANDAGWNMPYHPGSNMSIMDDVEQIDHDIEQ